MFGVGLSFATLLLREGMDVVTVVSARLRKRAASSFARASWMFAPTTSGSLIVPVETLSVTVSPGLAVVNWAGLWLSTWSLASVENVSTLLACNWARRRVSTALV